MHLNTRFCYTNFVIVVDKKYITNNINIKYTEEENICDNFSIDVRSSLPIYNQINKFNFYIVNILISITVDIQNELRKKFKKYELRSEKSNIFCSSFVSSMYEKNALNI